MFDNSICFSSSSDLFSGKCLSIASSSLSIIRCFTLNSANGLLGLKFFNFCFDNSFDGILNTIVPQAGHFFRIAKKTFED